MGQKPYLSDLEGGKQIQQVRSHAKLLEILGVKGRAKAVSTMSDEFTIYVDSPALRDELHSSLETAWVGEPGRALFFLQVLENAIRVNLLAYGTNEVTAGSPICFPQAPGAPRMNYEDLIYNTGHLKSGCHDPRGMVMFYGAGVPQGVHLRMVNNLDFAPTFLRILDPLPEAEMHGQVCMEQIVGGCAATPPVQRCVRPRW